jgi:hypothetical protein
MNILSCDNSFLMAVTTPRLTPSGIITSLLRRSTPRPLAVTIVFSIRRIFMIRPSVSKNEIIAKMFQALYRCLGAQPIALTILD